VVNQPSRILTAETVDTVLAFYQNDAFSRVMPGKADCITVRNSNGEKMKTQKRHLTMTLSEAYCCFKADHPQINIGKSKFANLRPKWVFVSSQMPHNVCGCRYHENVSSSRGSSSKISWCHSTLFQRTFHSQMQMQCHQWGMHVQQLWNMFWRHSLQPSVPRCRWYQRVEENRQRVINNEVVYLATNNWDIQRKC